MKRTVLGILAHVDAGKTTLSEALLYCAGVTRNLGRVDHGSAFLDTFALERQRGITIFSKEALLTLPERQITLLDTPGHADFSGEMERALSVLDCAVLVVSGPAGVQSHTMTVWKLLRRHRIPTFIFVNKMDLPGAERGEILALLRRSLGDGVSDLSEADMENAAMGSEALMEEYLDTFTLSQESIRSAVAAGKIFPCVFGSALQLDGVEQLLAFLSDYAPETADPGEFAARVYKISRDERGERLTHLKVTGGTLRVRETLRGRDWEEKVTQLRQYSGARFKAIDVAYPGDVVAVTGLSRSFGGQGLGLEADSEGAQLQPVLTYRVEFPAGTDMHKALQQFRQLEDEEPLLHVDWNEALQELRLQLMGSVQLEVLQELVKSRFGMEVRFGQGSILYRETIRGAVEGVGHFEPLRHYAEVHLLLVGGERGSGLRFESDCSEDELDRNWQRLILTHLMERTHLGVLTGSPITDMRITLLSGRAHAKHTEGGDFRQATYRAVRQGLMEAESVLLEPWMSFTLEVPLANVGRALSDLQRMNADFAPPETLGDMSLLSGRISAAALGDYPTEIAAYTHGKGRFSCAFEGYAPCADAESVIAAAAYDPEGDSEHSPDSVFCSHGAGHTVKWYDVKKQMHLPSALRTETEEEESPAPRRRYSEIAATDKELMGIFERTYGPIKRSEPAAVRPAPRVSAKPYQGRERLQGPEYLLIDGYNIIHAWQDMKKLAAQSLDLARERLIERLRSYQAYLGTPVIVVFDAYRVKGNPGSLEKLGGLTVVYTEEAETADMYIEKVTGELGKKHPVRVATSDALEQVIILGHGALRLPASLFEKELLQAEKEIRSHLQR